MILSKLSLGADQFTSPESGNVSRRIATDSMPGTSPTRCRIDAIASPAVARTRSIFSAACLTMEATSVVDTERGRSPQPGASSVSSRASVSSATLVNRTDTRIAASRTHEPTSPRLSIA